MASLNFLSPTIHLVQSPVRSLLTRSLCTATRRRSSIVRSPVLPPIWPQRHRPFSSYPQPTSTHATTVETKEDIYTLPNAITVARIVASPFIGYTIATQQYPLALSLLAAAAASDLLDGWIARRFNMTSKFGSVLDPAADKILMTVLTVSLCTADLLSVPLAALIIGRDAGLVTGTMYYRYTSLPEPKTWTRYWDVSLPSAEIKPPLISKANTALQLALMYFSLAAPVYGVPVDHAVLEALRYTVAGTTVASTLTYWFDSNNLVRKL